MESVVRNATILVCQVIRLATLWLVNIQLDGAHKIQDVKSIMEFSWEKEDPNSGKKGEKKPQTLTEMKAILKGLAAAPLNRKKRKQR